MYGRDEPKLLSLGLFPAACLTAKPQVWGGAGGRGTGAASCRHQWGGAVEHKPPQNNTFPSGSPRPAFPWDLPRPHPTHGETEAQPEATCPQQPKPPPPNPAEPLSPPQRRMAVGQTLPWGSTGTCSR